MRIVMLSISHRTASVDLRERIAIAGERLAAAIDGLRSGKPLAEAVVLSTCNRTELYIARPAQDASPHDELCQFLARFSNVSMKDIASVAVIREQEEAIAHLFRVATGLESMVLGEPQILGQVKQAYEKSQQMKAAGPVLHRVFQQAISVAKQVRHESGIGEGRVSIGSVAVDFASQIFERFDDKVMVAVGAGEMAKITLKHLQALKPAKLWLTNRTRQRAEDLAARMPSVSCGVRGFDELDNLLVEADIVLTSTGAQQPIITEARFKPLIRRRRSRPIFIVDIAVPRDVEPAVGNLSNVYLYNIDDLQRVVLKTHETRSAQVDQCELMVREAARSCIAAVQHRDVGHLIRALRERLHAYAKAERERTLKRLAGTPIDDLPEAFAAAMDEHDHRLVNKILHLPLSQLDPKDANGSLAFAAEALRQLFGLDEKAADADPLPAGEGVADDEGDAPAPDAPRADKSPLGREV